MPVVPFVTAAVAQSKSAPGLTPLVPVMPPRCTPSVSAFNSHRDRTGAIKYRTSPVTFPSAMMPGEGTRPVR